jgi:rhodanese-related sulfurtransferase
MNQLGVKLTKNLVLILMLAFMGTACSSEASSVTNLSVTQFAEEIKQPSIQILDVRTPAEFAEGHLANSLNIDFESGNFAEEIKKLDKSKSYAVYCRSGRRSALAAAEMSKAGFHHILNMSGGTIDWTTAGLPLVK